MAGSQQQNDAAAEVKKVAQTDHTQGATNALDMLMKDYKAYQAGHNSADSKSYWDAVTTQLNGDSGKKLLPDLAVAWGKENLSTADLAGTGGLNAADLKQFDRYDQSNPQNAYDKTFADGLLANNASLLSTLSKNDDGYYATTSADAGAFQSYLDNQTKANQKLNDQSDALTGMAPLMANNGALFKSLDTAKDPNSKADGNISNGDMDAWIATAQRLKEAGQLPADGTSGGVFNQQNLDYVDALRHGKLGVKDGKLVEDGSGKQVLGGDAGSSWLGLDQHSTNLQGLAKEGGFDASNGNLGGAVDAFNKQVTSDSAITGAAIPSDVPTPAGTTTATGTDGSTVVTDAAGNTVTKNKAGDTYDIHQKGANTDETVKLGTDGKPSDVTLANGDAYTKDPKTGKWTGPDGKTDFTFDAAKGTIGYTDGAKKYSVDESGKVTDTTAAAPATPPDPGTEAFKALPADQQTKIREKVVSDLVAQSAAQAGDGYIKIAARLLGKPNANDTDPDVAKLYKELEKANHDKPLYVGTPVLTPEILKSINDAKLNAQLVADRDQLVKQNFGAPAPTPPPPGTRAV